MPVYDEFLGPLKKVRKLRQSPAHKIRNNAYDETLFKKQMDLLKDVLYALHKLRIVFSVHPLAQGIKVTNWIDEGKVKMF